ncbi:MAG: hypothetical protein ACW987_00600 [Candidatus Thorarchaeota archaeon]|jgi:hypothetical protein
MINDFEGNKTHTINAEECYTHEYVEWLEERLTLARKKIRKLNNQNTLNRNYIQKQHKEQQDYLDYEDDRRE